MLGFTFFLGANFWLKYFSSDDFQLSKKLVPVNFGFKIFPSGNFGEIIILGVIFHAIIFLEMIFDSYLFLKRFLPY